MRNALSMFVLFVAAAACRTGPDPTLPAATAGAEIAQLRVEMQGLMSLFASSQQTAAVTGMPAADTIGLEGRLGALTDRLDDLLARLPASAAPRTVEATSSRRAAGDETCIAALRAAIAVVDCAQQVSIENIANVNTCGYKRRELLATSEPDHATGLVLPRAHGVRTLYTMGALEITDRNLDLAIDGEGFFAVASAIDGSTGYTRDGRLRVNADGKLVTANGDVLQPEIAIPTDTLEISFDPTGIVSGRTAGCPDSATAFGELAITRFHNPDGLGLARAGLLRATEDSGPPLTQRPGTVGLGLLKQGFVERSNVQLLDESVNLQVWRRQRHELRRALAGYGVFTP